MSAIKQEMHTILQCMKQCQPRMDKLATMLTIDHILEMNNLELEIVQKCFDSLDRLVLCSRTINKECEKMTGGKK